MRYLYLLTVFLFLIVNACQPKPYLETENERFLQLISQKGWAENKHESGLYYHFDTIDVACDGGCNGRICGVDCGDGCVRPCYYSKVEIKYDAYLLEDYLAGDETPLLTSGSSSIKLDVEDMILGVKIALIDLEQFSLRSKAYIMIPSHLAYGLQGFGEVVPEHAALVFYIELIESHPHY